MNITMTYQLKTDSLPHTIELRPEEYFDPLEPEESYDEDGVPAYQNAFEYIGCTPDDLKWAITKVFGNRGARILREQYLDGIRSMMVHVTDSDGSEEIIHSNEIGENKWHIIRTLKSAKGSWSVILNSLTDESPQVKQVTADYHTNWSHEEMVQFCDTL